MEIERPKPNVHDEPAQLDASDWMLASSPWKVWLFVVGFLVTLIAIVAGHGPVMELVSFGYAAIIVVALVLWCCVGVARYVGWVRRLTR